MLNVNYLCVCSWIIHNQSTIQAWDGNWQYWICGFRHFGSL